MGIALFTSDGLFAPLQAAFEWLANAVQPRSLPPAYPGASSQGARCARRTLPPAQSAVRRFSGGPVRVLRVVDAQAPATCGRMVISGRMADVCAELDRMASYDPSTRHRPRSSAASQIR